MLRLSFLPRSGLLFSAGLAAARNASAAAAAAAAEVETIQPSVSSSEPGEFQHLFRCPLCFGAAAPLSFSDGEISAVSKGTAAIKRLMTGVELDFHLRRCSGVHHRRRCDYFAQLRAEKLEERDAIVKGGGGRGDATISNASRWGNRGAGGGGAAVSGSSSSSSAGLSIGTRKAPVIRFQSTPFFGARRFRGEMHHSLSALPCTLLIDRVLILDTTNVQYNNSPGFVFAAPLSEYLWAAAFGRQRVAVVFVHEMMLPHRAPIFNALGALAEGSANLHDGRTTNNGSNNSSAPQQARWRTRSGSWRLDDGYSSSLFDDEWNVGDAGTSLGIDASAATPAAVQRNHAFRPWNSVVVPTRRDPEAGDYALFLTVRKLSQMLQRDEEKRSNSLFAADAAGGASSSPTAAAAVDGAAGGGRMRVTRTATQIDVVTRDTELFFALTALAAGATGRVNVFHGLAQWAEHVEADMQRCVF